jgi:hypothetical protein
MVTDSLSVLLSGMRLWKGARQDALQERRLREKAIATVMEAAIATKAYQYDLEQGNISDRQKEHELSRLWQQASSAISEYDQELSQSGQLKALGWADAREWKRCEGREWAVSLDKIIEQCEWLRKNK